MQPPHLRHLAIIRRPVTNDGIIRYFHYSWDVIRKKIAAHELDPADIPGLEKALESHAEAVADRRKFQLLSTTGDFGFHTEESLSTQVELGQATFRTLIRAAAPGDIEPRDGDPIVVLEGTDLVLGVRGEVSGPSRMSNPRANASSRRQTISTVGRTSKRKRASQADPDVPRGRPRKYPRGTEKFWRMQVKRARLDTGPSEERAQEDNIGDAVMKALHANVPTGFDKLLVAAIDARLPAPISPVAIDQAWMNSTSSVLRRSSDGVYISPMGLRGDNFRKLSRVMIVKSPRLMSIDFSDRSKVHPFRLISSSASHSFAYRRYYPSLLSSPPRLQRTTINVTRQKSRIPAKSTQKKMGPRLGVFYEDNTTSTSAPVLIEDPVDYHILPELLDDTTDDEAALSNEHDQRTRTSSTTSADETRLNATVDAGQEKVTPPEKPSIQERLALPKTVIPPIQPARSIRKRKLTEKAAQLQRTREGRGMRLFSETRSIASADSVVQDKVDGANTQEMHPMLVDGILDAAMSTPSVTEQMTRGELPIKADNNYVQSGGSPAEEPLAEEPTTAEPPAEESLTEEPPAREPPTEKASTEELSSEEPPAGKLPTEEPPIEGPATEEPPTEGRPIEDPTPAVKNKTRTTTHSESQKPRPKQKHTKGAYALCRKIAMELVAEANGVVPSDTFTIRRISGTRWQEAGEQDKPLLKNVKAAVKILCNTGQLKQLTFQYRAKSGTMVTRSVLFLPSVDRGSSLIEDMKQKIINADPLDYIPPEWNAEAARVPLVDKNAPRINTEVEWPLTRTRRASSTENDDRPAKRRRAPSAASTRSVASASDKRTRSLSKDLPETVVVDTTICFITLKVPKLGSLPAVQLRIWRSECSIPKLLRNESITNPWQPSTAKLKPGRRNIRKPGPRASRKSINWQNFPSSLSDILEQCELKLTCAEFESEDLDWQRFACEVECVRAWEEQESGSALSPRTKYAFIQHMVPQALYAKVVLPTTTSFHGLVDFDSNGSELEMTYPVTESWPMFVDALQASPEDATHITTRNGPPLEEMPPQEQSTPADETVSEGLRRTRRPTKRKIVDEDVVSDPDLHDIPETPVKRQRKNTRTAKVAVSKRQKQAALSFAAPKRTRGERWTQNMSEDRVQRILVSVIAIRTLTGGVGGFIDWPLVKSLFPINKEAFLKSSWEVLSTRYRSDIEAITKNFRDKFAEALEAGEAPDVNFGDLKATNWNAVVSWALNKLDCLFKPLNDLEQGVKLPETREKLLDSHVFAFDEPTCWRPVCSQTSFPAKEDILASSIFGTSSTLLVKAPLRKPRESDDAILRNAKRWALSAILTSPSEFDPQKAHTKLACLASSPQESDRLLLRALKGLEEGKIIQKKAQKRQVNDSSGMCGWEAHPAFMSSLESVSPMSPAMLHRAFEHKLGLLDPSFANGEPVLVEREAVPDDGEMVAVLNLMSMGQVRARSGPDVPRSRYGIDHERVGYKARLMDKKLLGFGVKITPTEKYVSGDTMAQGRRITIPQGDFEAEKGTPPLWIDIHGNVNLELWNVLLSGMMGLVTQMPGIAAEDISKTFGTALELGDVELMVSWAVQAGFLKKDEKAKGYLTGEWWWLCINVHQDEGQPKPGSSEGDDGS